MCGIAGFISDNPDKMIRKIFTDVLVNSVSRGRDAAGVVVTTPNNKMRMTKYAYSAPVFVKDPAYKKIMDFEPNIVIGHVRAATKGSPRVNKNNHPIRSGNIVGVHNGIIFNDEELTNKMGLVRNAQVDSEVIFSLLDQVKALNLKTIKEALSSLQGNYAIAFQSLADPQKIWLARGTGRPLVTVYDPKYETLWFVSELRFVEKAYTKHRESTERLIVRELAEGEIISVSPFQLSHDLVAVGG